MTTIHICVGLPGSGKTSYYHNMEGNKLLCEADSYFDKNGQYIFNPSYLGAAHAYCMRKYANAVCRNENGLYRHIVVGNTNTRIEHITPYTSLAGAFNVPFRIVRFNVSVDTSFKRNVHNVPLKTILRMENDIRKLTFPKEWEVVDIFTEEKTCANPET